VDSKCYVVITPCPDIELEYLAILNSMMAENIILKMFVFAVVKRTIEL
jgi:hypothetical protein